MGAYNRAEYISAIEPIIDDESPCFTLVPSVESSAQSSRRIPGGPLRCGLLTAAIVLPH